MSREYPESRVWGVFVLLLWLGFFTLGLFPDFFYEFLRHEANVVTSRAMVNSVFLLYSALIVYLFGFLYRASRDAGLSSVMSQVLAVQLSMVALLAFLPVRLEFIPDYLRAPDATWRRLILTVCAFKVASWIYLVTLLFRYYLFSGAEVFRQMAPVFPSARQEAADTAEAKAAENRTARD